MDIIRPTTITDAMLISTTVPETDYTEYNPATTYGDGDKIIVAADHKIYESLQAANTGHTPSTSPTWWLDYSATNRWELFDEKVGSQTTQTTSMIYVLQPGFTDSLALLNLDAVTAQIVMIDPDTDLATNGTAWTGASGVTPPTGWNLVGSPSDFTIDSGALRITVDAVNEGISQTITVVSGTEMQLLGIYRNTAGDIAQYAVYDVTHSANILATTDLASSTVNSTISYIFTVPVGCTSVRISLLAKTSGDIVWFDTVSLSETVYNTTIDLLNTQTVVDWYTYFFEPITVKTDAVKTDIPLYLSGIITTILTYTGSTAKCGALLPGLKRTLGDTKYSPTVGIIDYSIKEADAFGNYTITERAYSKRMSLDLHLANTSIDEVNRLLALYRATPLVWIGSEDYSALIVYGFFKDFNIEIPYPDYSACSLEIEGLI